jgi:hypothetical protein
MEFLTILVYVYTVFGILAPVDVPDGKGGFLHYTTVGHVSHCLEKPITIPDGKGEYLYFCVV